MHRRVGDNRLAGTLFFKIGGDIITGMEAWHLVAPLIAAHSVAQYVKGGPENEVIVSAGLLDKNENCIVYAKPEKVEAVSSA